MPNSWQDDPQGYLQGVIGSPVTITSGYRSPQKNAAVGGVPNSAHLSNQAFDFVPKGVSMSDAAAKLQQSGIPFDQLINEGDHVHISFAPQNRRQVLGKVAQQSISDDDLFGALTGAKSAPVAPADSPSKSLSDDQLFSALTKSTPASQQGDNSAPSPIPSQQAQGGGPSYMGRPFGFGQEVDAHIPFGKDVAAGVPAILDAITGKGSIGTNYHKNLADFNAAQAGYESQNPGLSTVGSGLGFVAAGAPAKAEAGIQTLAQLIKSGAKGGAALGGLFGAGTPSSANDGLDQRAGNALSGAATGLVAGAGIPVLGAGVAAGGRAVGGMVNKLIPDAATAAAKRAKAIIEDFAGGELDPNPTQMVPGSQPTLAESVKNPGVSVLQKQIAQLNPNSPLVSRAAQNAQARLESLEKTTGTKADLEDVIDTRDKAATADLAQVFSTPKTADVQPVLDKIKEIEEGTSGQRPAIAKSMGELRSLLADGKITDAETLYNSTRKGIGDLMDSTDPAKSHGKAAMSQILQVRDELDKAIGKAAPGFQKYLSDYAESSGPVTSMKYLQGLNLTDAQGNLTLPKVQNAIKTIAKQQAMPGKREADAVTEAQLGSLRSIRDDLLRQSNLDLNKARGSDTVQNLMAQKRLGLSRFIPEGIGATAGAGLGGVVAGPHGAELGGMIGDRLGAMVGSARAARQAQSQNMLQATLEDILLNPSKYHNPTTGGAANIPSLTELLNRNRSRASMATTNRLLIGHQTGQEDVSR